MAYSINDANWKDDLRFLHGIWLYVPLWVLLSFPAMNVRNRLMQIDTSLERRHHSRGRALFVYATTGTICLKARMLSSTKSRW